MKKKILILFILTAAAGAQAQQLPIYSQYLYNRYLINPAFAGSEGYTSINLTTRQQWIGYEGAPHTYSLSYQGRLLKQGYSIKENLFNKKIFRSQTEGKVGLAASVFSDLNGLVRRTGFSAAYSYHTWLNGATQISFGLAFTGYMYKMDEKQMQFEDPDDPWMYSDLRKGIYVPDFNFGVCVLNRNYTAGFSVMDLMEGFARVGSEAYDNLKIERTYNLYVNYDFDLDSKNVIQPSLLLKMSEQLRPQADIGVTYIYDRKFWLGAAFRTGSALITNVGVRKDKVFFGYSFDFTLEQIQRSTYGSHELVLAIRFGDSLRKYRWLDRY